MQIYSSADFIFNFFLFKAADLSYMCTLESSNLMDLSIHSRSFALWSNDLYCRFKN